MALIKCPQCNKEISDQQISCHHCSVLINSEIRERIFNERYDNKQEPQEEIKSIKKSKKNNFLLYGVIVSIIFIILMLIGKYNSNKEASINTDSSSQLESESVFNIPIDTKYSAVYLNVRAAPDVNSKLLKIFKPNDEVIIRLHEKNGFTQVILDSTSAGYVFGWCKSKYLIDNPLLGDSIN